MLARAWIVRRVRFADIVELMKATLKLTRVKHNAAHVVDGGDKLVANGRGYE